MYVQLSQMKVNAWVHTRKRRWWNVRGSCPSGDMSKSPSVVRRIRRTNVEKESCPCQSVAHTAKSSKPAAEKHQPSVVCFILVASKSVDEPLCSIPYSSGANILLLLAPCSGEATPSVLLDTRFAERRLDQDAGWDSRLPPK